MPSFRSTLIRGAMLGYASGILSQAGIATVLERTPGAQLPGIVRNPWVKRLAGINAVGEVAANAFVTSLPPRTSAGPLAGRIALGALAGGLATRGDHSSGLAGAMGGAAVAPVRAWVSTTSRARLASFVPDKLLALVETVVAFGLARKAT